MYCTFDLDRGQGTDSFSFTAPHQFSSIIHHLNETTNIHDKPERFLMPATQKKAVNPQVDVKIVTVKGDHVNYFVKPLKIDENTKVVWHCGINNFTIWFPKDHNPIANGHTEIYGKNGKASAVVGSEKGNYAYCILVTDEEGHVHLVEGNSPPVMEIQ
jgi:hypothetical protein